LITSSSQFRVQGSRWGISLLAFPTKARILCSDSL
jgi:hypothetical protein